MKRVVYSGPQHALAVVKEMLGRWFEVHAVDATPESLLPAFCNCDVFLDASMKVRIDADAIRQAEELELVVAASTGTSHIDAGELERRRIPLLSLKGQKEALRDITAAAEHTWALILAAARRVPAAVEHVRQGNWNRVSFPGLMLKDKVIGIIGLGRIGGWVARYAHAFGMTVRYFDPSPEHVPDFAEFAPLESLVSVSDVISLHVHLSDSTKGMIQRSLIHRFKEGAIFVNTSRGELTDEAAIVEALEARGLAAAAVDVLADEPNLPQSQLWRYAQTHPNVIITPHMGGYCPEAVDRVVRFSCTRILDFFQLR